MEKKLLLLLAVLIFFEETSSRPQEDYLTLPKFSEHLQLRRLKRNPKPQVYWGGNGFRINYPDGFATQYYNGVSNQLNKCRPENAIGGAAAGGIGGANGGWQGAALGAAGGAIGSCVSDIIANGGK